MSHVVWEVLVRMYHTDELLVDIEGHTWDEFGCQDPRMNVSERKHGNRAECELASDCCKKSNKEPQGDPYSMQHALTEIEVRQGVYQAKGKAWTDATRVTA